jgi:hypothetical protein
VQEVRLVQSEGRCLFACVCHEQVVLVVLTTNVSCHCVPCLNH